MVQSMAFTQEVLNRTDANGLKQGKWVGRYPDGKLKYEGTFENNQPTGAWKRYHENGQIKAVLSYRFHSARAFASLFDEEGRRYAMGLFDGTQRDSCWNFYSGENLVLTENYRLGRKEGKSIAYGQDGKILSEKMWKGDQLDGISIEYYPAGIKRNEITWSRGKKHGPAHFYDENGTITTEGNYNNDLSNGLWKIFDKSGKIKYQVTYENGEIKNGSELDSMKMKEFRQYDRVKGKIAEPKREPSANGF